MAGKDTLGKKHTINIKGLSLGLKVTIAVAAVTILVLGAITVNLLLTQSRQYESRIGNEIMLAHGTLEGLLQEATRGNQRQAAELAMNPEIQRLFSQAAANLGPIWDAQARIEAREGKPVRITDEETLRKIASDPSMARLRDLTSPIYHQQHDTYGLGQLQFHLPPAHSFFRAHTTKKVGDSWTLGSLGDDLSTFRFTVLAANGLLKDKGYDKPQATMGLEVGRGGPGLRGVVPVFFKGHHVGSVEFGGGIGDTIRTENSFYMIRPTRNL